MVGPRTMPPIISPSTLGCRKRRISCPNKVAQPNITVIWRANFTKSCEFILSLSLIFLLSYPMGVRQVHYHTMSHLFYMTTRKAVILFAVDLYVDSGKNAKGFGNYDAFKEGRTGNRGAWDWRGVG